MNKVVASRGQDVCTSKQEVVASNPARVACEGFFHGHSESTEYMQCKTHVGVRAKLNQSLHLVALSREQKNHCSSWWILLHWAALHTFLLLHSVPFSCIQQGVWEKPVGVRYCKHCVKYPISKSLCSFPRKIYRRGDKKKCTKMFSKNGEKHGRYIFHFYIWPDQQIYYRYGRWLVLEIKIVNYIEI